MIATSMGKQLRMRRVFRQGKVLVLPLDHPIYFGPQPGNENPAELLASPRMADVIEELKQVCDFLLIDTPPVLPVSDALALAPNVDAVILTARLRSTTREEMSQVRMVLDRANARVIGVVAGGVKTKGNYYYKRGYNYGYGYK